MAGGAPDDVLRSLRRYVWLTLGSTDVTPAWTVRVQRTRVADDERPVAVVEESGPLTTPFARATITQGDVQKMQSYAVVCYPVIETTAAAAAEGARQVAALLDAGFSRGLVTSDDPPVLIGGPWRLPIYDFAGVPVTGTASERKGPTEPYMHADIDLTFNVRPIQDALDELRFTVVANLRVNWWAGGRIPPAKPKVADYPGSWLPAHP